MKNFKAVKIILGQINQILNRKQKKRAVIVVISIVIGAMFELLGVSAFLPFVQVLLTPDVIMNNSFIRPIIVFFHISDATELMILLGIALALLYIVKNAYLMLSYYIRCSYSAGIQKELSLSLLKSYLSRPYAYFLNVNSGEVIRGCNEDVAGVYTILFHCFTLISEILTICAIGVYLFYVDATIAVGALLLMFAIMFILIFLFRPVMKKLGRKFMEAKALRNKALLQTIQGVKELYVMQRKELFLDDYGDASESVKKVQRKSEFINWCPDRIIEGLCISGMILIVVGRLAMGGDVTAYVPKLATFAMAAFKIMPSVSKVSSRVTGIVYFRPMLEHVYSIVQDARAYERENEQYVNNELDSKSDKIEFKDIVSVKNVQWKYEGQNKPILENVTLDIHKGESVALIGMSGAGKTTLADVILGLLKPQKGSVYMDGTDVYTIPKKWAKVIGYVPQSVFLIDDTIRNNVAFGVKEIDDDFIWKTLELAQLKKFVEELPDGLDTIVGERGVKLSGGQRQRIAIARALFNEPQILVLDEATASLDNDTEDAVMEAIDALQGQITMIIVAHRLSTIRNCNTIYEVNSGEAVKRQKSEVLSDEILNQRG